MTSNNNQYCGSSKPVECQLWMRLLCTSTVPKIAYLLCRCFASNDNQYYASSKPVECQLSMRLLCRFIASIWILHTASTKSVLLRKLVYLPASYIPTSEFHQYCQRIPRQYQASSMPMLGTVLTGSTGITPRSQLAQYLFISLEIRLTYY